jgi:outer membrane lipoprotein SlyB
MVGGIVGATLGDSMSDRAGIEYSVILSSGEERTLVQEYLPADRVLSVSESCRLQVAADGRKGLLFQRGRRLERLSS